MALGAGRNFNILGTVERGDFNRCAQESFGNRDLFIQGQVTLLSLKKRVVGDVYLQI